MPRYIRYKKYFNHNAFQLDMKKLDMKPFPSHMTLEDAMKLSANDTIDHRDSVGRFAIATVSEKNGLKLKIHYNGWGPQYDTWSDVSVELHRFASAGSISQRPSHHAHFNSLRKGDHVDINPSQKHVDWKDGIIHRFDQHSGQVQVRYQAKYHQQDQLHWTHLDNVDEIAPFATNDRGRSAQGKAWEPIDIVKALLWDSDGKSLHWITRQLGRTKYDVKRKIILEKKKKEMEKRKEINKQQRQNNKENTHVIEDTTRKRKLVQTKDNNMNEPPNKKVKLNNKTNIKCTTP
eukprot:288818_1